MTFVAAGGIVRNRAWCLPDHLTSVLAACIHFDYRLFYVTGDNKDNTEGVLNNFSFLCGERWGEAACSYLVHDTGEPGYTRDGSDGPRYKSAHMAAERNLWAEEALKRWPQATHLWVVDSDVIPEPDVLEKLLAVDAPVAGAYVPVADGIPIYMEGVRQTLIGAIWLGEGRPRDPNTFTPYRTGKERERTEPFECHLVGGSYLIRRDVIEEGPEGARAFTPPWSEHQLGEDGGFQQYCHEWGFKMIAVPTARCEHVMERDDK